MKHIGLAFSLTLLAGLLLYPVMLSTLVRVGAGQRVQAYGPASHRIKEGTPTMGGLLFVILAAAAWLVVDHSRHGFVAAYALVGGALLGLTDDVANVRGRGALGLYGRQKLAVQGLIGLLVGIGVYGTGDSRQMIPFIGSPDPGVLIVPLVALVVMATSNAVNLTDGVDGLAGTCSALVFAATWAIAVHYGNRGVAVISAALLGGLLAFLFFNWFPARIFMGDTGAMALGCALAVMAAELHILWLLPLLGVVFLAETLSVIINVTAIRRFHRRVFRSSPIHHHFEALGLREERLVACFAVVAALGALLTVLIVRSVGVHSS